MKISHEVFELKCPFKPSWLTVHFSPPVTHLISVVFALSRWYWLRCQVWRSCKNSVPSLIIEESWLSSRSLRRSLSTRRVPGSPSIRLSPPTARLGPDATWRVFFFFYDAAGAPFLPFHVTLFITRHMCAAARSRKAFSKRGHYDISVFWCSSCEATPSRRKWSSVRQARAAGPR